MRLSRIGVGILALAIVVGVMSGSISSQPTVTPNFAIEHDLKIATGQIRP